MCGAKASPQIRIFVCYMIQYRKEWHRNKHKIELVISRRRHDIIRTVEDVGFRVRSDVMSVHTFFRDHENN